MYLQFNKFKRAKPETSAISLAAALLIKAQQAKAQHAKQSNINKRYYQPHNEINNEELTIQNNELSTEQLPTIDQVTVDQTIEQVLIDKTEELQTIELKQNSPVIKKENMTPEMYFSLCMAESLKYYVNTR